MRKMKTLNKILIAVSLILNTICLVLTLLGKYNSNILVIIVYYSLLFIPATLRKFKVNITNTVEFIYQVFIIFSCLLGSIMHFYGMIYWYDSLVHYISGLLTALFGFMLLVNFRKYSKDSIVFNTVFVTFVSLAIAALWEIFEFTADNLLGGDAQKVLTTGVTDTMKDIICALLASFLVSLLYTYEHINKKELLVNKFIKSLK